MHSHGPNLEVVIGAVAALITATSLSAAVSSVDGTDAATSNPDLVARQAWHTRMLRTTIPKEGCYHASYPKSAWEKIDCSNDALRAEIGHPKRNPSKPVGSYQHLVARGHGLIGMATGTFPSATVASESSVGGSGAIDGPNEYSLQLNTNFDQTTNACAGHSGCTVFQQFVYATDELGKGKGALLIQYWLIDFGSKKCPSHFKSTPDGSGFDCVRDSTRVKVPNIPSTQLGGGRTTLSAVVTAGGLDAAVLFFGSDIFTVSAKDNILDIATVWKDAEYNVFGDGGGSEAIFNPNASINVLLSFTDGTTTTPDCLLNDTFTGETNNLLIHQCNAGANTGVPFVTFTETAAPPPIPPPPLSCAELREGVTTAENALTAAQNREKTPACEGALSVECLQAVRSAEQALTAAEAQYKQHCP